LSSPPRSTSPRDGHADPPDESGDSEASPILRIRPADDEDCALLWEWANEANVRAAAFQSDPIPWEEHLAWFRRKREDPNCLLYILSDQRGDPIGQVRFDVGEDRRAEVDISIARSQRGRGYGTAALCLACDQLFRTDKAREAVAYIKPQNTPSIQAFESAGFAREGTGRAMGHEAVRMTRRPVP
jgi:RimJ/RimL family protein N-acetyltransferase